ncbi:hypothetical protein [Nocardia transvalensis]|uniref:hypothetical protein n=1 Tax=Nocardia transvalensis TaxID=37333 RepID=UPI0018947373|nr:hypothetical protein [Nocardia transvalensis]MBF6332136.1 hypothetical protein [Nocardia transvalensis]
MLILTPTAIEAVRNITSAQGAPEDAGLRFFVADDAQTLQAAVTAAPAEQDQVVTAEGSRVFLDQQAAALLDDKILDTGVDANGQGGFVLGQQGQDMSGN